jgi:hypothetical protein
VYQSAGLGSSTAAAIDVDTVGGEEEAKLPSGAYTGAELDANNFFGQELQKVKDKREVTSIGRFMMDIVNVPKGAKWGHYNDRRVDQKWVRDLVGKFKGTFEHRDDEKVIPVVVRRSWIVLPEGGMGLLKANGVPLEEIPVVKFTPSGLEEIEREGLWMMGGNHRQLALHIWVGEMKKELNMLTDRAGKLRAKGNETGDTLATSAAAEIIMKRAKQLEEKMARSSLWLVNLYDRGA